MKRDLTLPDRYTTINSVGTAVGLDFPIDVGKAYQYIADILLFVGFIIATKCY
jgi:hypothetical protein